MTEYIYATDGHEGHWLTGEEIVRCEDCKHYREGRHGFPNRCRLWLPNIDLDEVPNILPYGFCAWGERRDE